MQSDFVCFRPEKRKVKKRWRQRCNCERQKM